MFPVIVICVGREGRDTNNQVALCSNVHTLKVIIHILQEKTYSHLPK